MAATAVTHRARTSAVVGQLGLRGLMRMLDEGTSRDPQDLGRRARHTGALGFIPKDQLSEESLLAVIEASS